MATQRVRPRSGTPEEFFEKELHLLPGPLVGLPVVFQGVYAVSIRPGIGEAVTRAGVDHHLPIQVRGIQRPAKFANVFLVEKWVGIAVGDQDFRLGALALGRKR